jgi:DNA-directed RNA polymerase specialized sigma24 family protein
MTSHPDSFARLTAALRADPADPSRVDAEYEVHRRHFHRIVAFLREKIGGAHRRHLDSGVIADTAVRALLRKMSGGRVAVTGWEDVWRLLVVIADRKLYRQWVKVHRHKRDVRREAGDEPLDWTPARADDPAVRAAVGETYDQAFAALTPRHRAAIELMLDGHTPEEIGEAVGRDKRSVYRVIEEFRAALERALVTDPETDAS